MMASQPKPQPEPILIPFDPSAERKLIAAVIDDAVNLAAVTAVRPEYFYRGAHRAAWRAILALRSRREAATYETLLNELQNTGKLKEVGSEVDVLELVAPVDMSPHEHTVSGVRGNARVVIEKYIGRQLIRHAELAAPAGYDLDLDVWAQLGELRRQIDEARNLLAAGDFSHAPHDLEAQSARDLMAEELAPPKWAVPNLFAEGLNLLAGKPKKGKSALVKNLCIAISGDNNFALGQIEVTPGETLYLALEDNKRRMQRQLGQMLPTDKDGMPIAPEKFYIRYKWPALDAGGIEALDHWLNTHPNTRMIVIDTFEKVRGRAAKNATLYQADYGSVQALQGWAIDRGIAVVLVVHARKAGSTVDDVIDEVSGSTGLTGGADNVVVMRRENGITSLHRNGRDYIDSDEVWALKGDPETLRWEIEGELQAVKRSAERQEILDALGNFPMLPVELAKKMGKPRDRVRGLLHRMLASGDPGLGYDQISGCYSNLYTHTNTPNTPNRHNKPNTPNVRLLRDGPNRPLTGLRPDVAYDNGHSVSPVRAVRADVYGYFDSGPRNDEPCPRCGKHLWGTRGDLYVCQSPGCGQVWTGGRA